MEPLEILCLSEDLAVCVKPVGLLSQAGSGESMVSRLAEQLGGEIHPVHRLDREVGGVMVYARSARAAAELTRQMQNGGFRKEYLAVLTGVPVEPEGELRDLLFHDQRRNKTFVVDRQRKGVREARLLYRVLDREAETSLVWVRLLTGRTHQIRAQFAARGLPLLGDGRYGGGKGKPLLWSAALTLPLPEGKRRFQRLPERLGPFEDLETLIRSLPES